MAEDQKETSDASDAKASAAEKSAETSVEPAATEKTAEENAEESAWDAAGGAMDTAKEGAAKDAEKGLSPEAIQKRLDALGGESEDDRAAREEEERLAARREKMKSKKGRGKSGLRSAASKRLTDIGTKAPAKKKKRSASPYSAIATSDDIEGDALLETAARVNKWLQANSKMTGIVIGVMVLVAIGAGGWFYMQHKKDIAASTTLDQAVADVNGRIGDPDKIEDEDRPKDTTPIFKTVAERQDAALSKFREVTAKYPGTGAAYLARLSEGSLLLDKHDIPGAIAAYMDVKDSPLAKVDVEVHGRALENLGFAYELKADEGDTASYSDALKTFHELENTDVSGFQELGEYHQARIYEKQGDKARAEELLKKVYEAATKPGEQHPYPYLENLAEDRLRALDPTALPPKRAGALGGPMGNQMSEAQMRQLIEQMKKQQGHGEHGGGPPGQ